MGLIEGIGREYERMKREPDFEKVKYLITLRQRQKRAEQITHLHVAGSFTTGFLPIPFSDAPLLLANQAALFARIMYVYDMDNLSESVLTLVGQIGIGKLLSQNLTSAAKYLSGQALKFAPAIGTITGGMINGSVAAATTYAFGMAISAFCYQKSRNHSKGATITCEDIDNFNHVFNETFRGYCRKG